MTKKVTLLVILLPREATGLLVCARARVHVRVCMWQEAGPALHKRRVLSSSVSPHSPADRSPRQAVSDCRVQAVTAPGSACCLGACAHRARHPAWPARVLLGRCPRRQWVWNSATAALWSATRSAETSTWCSGGAGLGRCSQCPPGPWAQPPSPPASALLSVWLRGHLPSECLHVVIPLWVRLRVQVASSPPG